VTGKAFRITACEAETTTGKKALPAGVAFVPQPLRANIIAVPLTYTALQTVYDLLPREWNRLLDEGLAQPA
jgi:hypothetical protein